MKLNRIYHDDCMTFMKSMSDSSVDLTLTDIPYGECDKISGGLRILDKDVADRCDFDIVEFTKEIKRVTRKSIYIFCGIHQISVIYDELRKDLSTRLCHWQKRNPSPINGQHMWLSATENCLFAKYPNAVFNEFCQPNIWKFSSGKRGSHPTQKPLDLFVHLVTVSSCKGEIVFDPCLGSGTSAIAAGVTDRHYVGVEKNENFYRLSCSNIRRFSGGDIFSSVKENVS